MPSAEIPVTASHLQQNSRPPPSVAQILSLLFQTILEFSNGVLDFQSMPDCSMQGIFHFRHLSNLRALLANGIPLLLFLLAALALFAVTWPFDQAKKSKEEKKKGWWFKSILYSGIALTTLPLLFTLFLASKLLILVCFTVQSVLELVLGAYGWIKNVKDYLQAEDRGDEKAQIACEKEGKKAIAWTLKSAIYAPATIVNCATGNVPALYATSAAMAVVDIGINGAPAFNKLFEKIQESLVSVTPRFVYCLSGIIKFFGFIEKVFSPLIKFTDKVTDKIWDASVSLGQKLKNMGKKEERKTDNISPAPQSDATNSNSPVPTNTPTFGTANKVNAALQQPIPTVKQKPVEKTTVGKTIPPPIRISELIIRQRESLSRESNLSIWIQKQESMGPS